jgi:anti-sigma28 factor (negative regulator of flagellin synthesis)
MESPANVREHFSLCSGSIMNPINNVGPNSLVNKVTTAGVQKATANEEPKKPSLADRVEFSGLGHLLGALKNNDIRADKVASVKAQIQAGTYEDDKKLDAAVDRLLDDLTK